MIEFFASFRNLFWYKIYFFDANYSGLEERVPNNNNRRPFGRLSIRKCDFPIRLMSLWFGRFFSKPLIVCLINSLLRPYSMHFRIRPDCLINLQFEY